MEGLGAFKLHEVIVKEGSFWGGKVEKYNKLLSSAEDAAECEGRRDTEQGHGIHALVVPADAGPDVNKARGGQAWAKQKTD